MAKLIQLYGLLDAKRVLKGEAGRVQGGRVKERRLINTVILNLSLTNATPGENRCAQE